jgi:NTP pyrophosphatase (non-canonical NTP hydrolase)
MSGGDGVVSQWPPADEGVWGMGGAFNALARQVMAYRVAKGFETSWDNMIEKLALVMCECAEAIEAVRRQDMANFREELADVVIRVLDIAGSLDLDLEAEIQAKMIVNLGRPHKHGKTA